jgi:hypothetical protein
MASDYLPEGVGKLLWLVQMRSDSSHFDSDKTELRPDEAPLGLANVFAHPSPLPELFLKLARSLHVIIRFEVAGCCLHDATKNVMQLHVWEGSPTG